MKDMELLRAWMEGLGTGTLPDGTADMLGERMMERPRFRDAMLLAAEAMALGDPLEPELACMVADGPRADADMLAGQLTRKAWCTLREPDLAVIDNLVDLMEDAVDPSRGSADAQAMCAYMLLWRGDRPGAQRAVRRALGLDAGHGLARIVAAMLAIPSFRPMWLTKGGE